MNGQGAVDLERRRPALAGHEADDAELGEDRQRRLDALRDHQADEDQGEAGGHDARQPEHRVAGDPAAPGERVQRRREVAGVSGRARQSGAPRVTAAPGVRACPRRRREERAGSGQERRPGPVDRSDGRLVLGEERRGDRAVEERRGILLAVVDRPPQEVDEGVRPVLGLEDLREVLVDDDPGRARDRVAGRRVAVREVEPEVGRERRQVGRRLDRVERRGDERAGLVLRRRRRGCCSSGRRPARCSRRRRRSG